MSGPPDISAILEGLRAEGLSQSEIARRTRLNQGTISRLAAGATRRPSYETASRILALGAKTAADYAGGYALMHRKMG